MKITGQIKVIMPTQQVSDRFRKREFVLTLDEDPEYPQLRKLEFTQDKCELLDGYQEGQMVTVEFNLNGRKWTNPQGEDKYFNTDQAWRISSEQQQAPQQQQAGGYANEFPTQPAAPAAAPNVADSMPHQPQVPMPAQAGGAAADDIPF